MKTFIQEYFKIPKKNNNRKVAKTKKKYGSPSLFQTK